MRFRKPVFAEPEDLLENPIGVFLGVLVPDQSFLELFLERAQPTVSLPGGHRAPQLVGLTGREPSCDDCKFHHLLLKERHTESAFKDRFHFLAWILYRLEAIFSPEVWVNHVALYRSR